MYVSPGSESLSRDFRFLRSRVTLPVRLGLGEDMKEAALQGG
jgi:hypothetical protein